MRVCIIGLGRMGRGIAKNLVGRGHVAYGYDILPVSLAGINIVDDPGKCNGMDYTILALPTGNEVRSVLSKIPGDSGIILDTTTMGLDELKDALRIVNDKGLSYLTVRVEKGPRDAERGDLVLFVGGDESIYKRSEEFLKQLGTPIYIGSHEQATILKLISTTILIANTAILAEISPLIQKMGIDKDLAIKALSMSGADSAQLRLRLPWILSNNYPEAFSIDLAEYVVKELIRYTSEVDVDVTLTSVIHRLLKDGKAVGYGKKDFSELTKLFQS